MTYLKNVWSDLVEKRLWPVAVALLIALVAVPVALGGGGSEAAPAPVGATGATGPGTGAAQISLDPAVPARLDRSGKVRDPFLQRKPAKGATGPAGASAAAAPSPGSGTAPSGDAKASGGGFAGPSVVPGPPQAPKPTPPAPKDTYVVSIRIGKTGGARDKKEVESLAPLPTAENPFFVYLGVLFDEKTAVFLLSADVAATGDGSCKPRKDSCESVELRAGDTEFFDVTADDGKVTQYQLDVLKITKAFAAAPSQAVAARKAAPDDNTAPAKQASAEDDRNGEDGEDALSSDRYAVDDDTGLLQRVKGNARARAAAEPVKLPRFYPGS